MDRIKRISKWIQRVIYFLLPTLPLAIVLKWLLLPESALRAFLIPMHITARYAQQCHQALTDTCSPFTLMSRLLGACASLWSLLPLLVGLLVLKRLASAYYRGEIFTLANARSYRTLGLVFFIDALLIKPLHQALLSLAVTLNNPPGSRVIAIAFGTQNINMLLLGGLLIFISWIMIQGHRLQEENDLTV
jgi:hypothetical protein